VAGGRAGGRQGGRERAAVCPATVDGCDSRRRAGYVCMCARCVCGEARRCWSILQGTKVSNA
jgi:hypothetical protein